MGDIAREFLQVKVLRTFEPLNSLGADKLEELANKSQVEELPPGRMVFRQGEKDKRCVYLLSGTLELQITGNPNTELVKAKTLEAKYPIAQEIPRPSTCRTKTNAVLLYIDSDLLEFLMDDSPSGLYEVTEIRVDEDPESDWMLRFLQSPAFLRLPTEKIQQLLMKFQEIPVQKGQVIIKQGDTDPWYYIVKEGQCVVSRRPAPAAEEVRLAILGPGDGFGEEALITHGKRNATIAMKDAGVLMRLGKQDFNDLLVKPLLQQVEHQRMMDKVRTGAAIIDVRTNKEFNENGINGAQNIPLSMLRLKAQSLNPTREHIIYCNDGSQSAAAAFLLAQHGINCFVLAGGINAQSKPFGAAPAVIDAPVETIAKSHLVPSTPAKMAPSTPAYVATGEFELHRYQAKTQAERANEAEKAHKNFSSRTQQLRSEADALRSQAQRLAEKTSAAESERKKAEAEIQRLQAEAAKQREEMLSTAKLAIAKEKERAQQEAARLKTEAEQARKRADEEANRIRREANEVAERQARLEAEFKAAEEQKRKAAQAAEEARRAAKLEAERVKQEAEQIRQRAMDEARQLRETLEAQRTRLAAEETAKRNAALDEAKRRAELAIQQAAQAAEESRRQAQLEADSIRRQAVEEAQRLRVETEREVKNSVLKRAQEQQRYEQELEVSRSRAMEQIQRQAEQEAAAIRQQALEETEQLRAEIEATRRLIENETLLAKSRLEEDAQRQIEEDAYARAAEEAAAHAAAEAARRAQEEARRRREEDLRAAEQARRVAELTRRAAEQEEIARRQREEEAAQQRIAMEEARRNEILQRAAAQQAHADEKARQRAEVLKERLKAQDIARQQPDEFLTQTGVGMKLATAKLHVVKDKTILEGEQDIFIFKAPSHRPPSREEAEALIRQAEQQMREQTRKELPAFDIEYADEPVKSTAKGSTDKSGFSESIITDLDQLAAYNKPRKESNDEFDFTLAPTEQPKQLKRSPRSNYRLYALAASVVVMIAVSVFAITRPTYVDANLVANITDNQPQNEQRGLASMRTPAPAPQVSPEQDVAAEKATAENRVRNEAEQEFQRMLSKWRSEHQTAAKPRAE